MPCLYVSEEIQLKCKMTEFTSCLCAILFCFFLANVHTQPVSPLILSLKRGNKHQSGASVSQREWWRERISHLYRKGMCPDKIATFFLGLEEQYADITWSWTEFGRLKCRAIWLNQWGIQSVQHIKWRGLGVGGGTYWSDGEAVPPLKFPTIPDANIWHKNKEIVQMQLGQMRITNDRTIQDMLKNRC